MAPRIGHGPFHLYWPWWPWKNLFYNTRPDILRSKTRAPEWAALSSEWRFFQAFFCFLGPPSHVLWNIKWPWTIIMTVTVVAIWQQEVATQAEEHITWDRHGIVKSTFSMTSFAMSLLLAFRVNRTYERWKEARSSLSGVGTGATSLFLQATTWVQDPEIVEDFRRFCIVWPYSIKQVVMGSSCLDPIAARLLHPAELAVYSGSRKGRQVVVATIRKLAHEAHLPLEQAMAMENVIQQTWKSAGDALRIKFQAMPEGVSLMCTGFVEIWCCLLPFGLIVDTGHLDWITIVCVAIASLLLLGVDEVSNQMEDPFKLMPVEDIVCTYERDINRVQAELRAMRAANADARRARQLSGSCSAGCGDSDKEHHTRDSCVDLLGDADLSSRSGIDLI